MADYVLDEESIAYEYRGAEYIQTFNCLWGKRTEFFLGCYIQEIFELPDQDFCVTDCRSCFRL